MAKDHEFPSNEDTKDFVHLDTARIIASLPLGETYIELPSHIGHICSLLEEQLGVAQAYHFHHGSKNDAVRSRFVDICVDRINLEFLLLHKYKNVIANPRELDVEHILRNKDLYAGIVRAIQQESAGSILTYDIIANGTQAEILKVGEEGYVQMFNNDISQKFFYLKRLAGRVENAIIEKKYRLLGIVNDIVSIAFSFVNPEKTVEIILQGGLVSIGNSEFYQAEPCLSLNKLGFLIKNMLTSETRLYGIDATREVERLSYNWTRANTLSKQNSLPRYGDLSQEYFAEMNRACHIAKSNKKPSLYQIEGDFE